MAVATANSGRIRLVAEFADCVAHHEGFYLTEADCKARKIPFPSLAQRHNNPGNLRAWGSFPIEDGYAKFDTVENGWRAVRRQCDRNIFDRGLTFLEFFAGQRKEDGTLINPRVSYPGFAPAQDADRKHGINRPAEYAKEVMDRLRKGAYSHLDWSKIDLNTKIQVLASEKV